MLRSLVAAACSLFLWGLVPAARALAYEDRVTLDFDAGVGVFTEGSLPCCGPQVALGASFGLGDAWSLRARGAYGFNPAALHVAEFGIELVYLLDIVQIVPFFGAGIDTMATVAHGDAAWLAGAHAVLGVDYLVSRDLAVGIDLRPQWFVRAAGSPAPDGLRFTVGARLSLLFEL